MSQTWHQSLQIPLHRAKMLQQTTYEFIGLFWRYVYLYFRVFCCMLTICSDTYHDPFCMIFNSFGYFQTQWRRSTKPFTKWLSRCGAKWICNWCFLPYAHYLLSHLLLSIFHDLGLVWIRSHSVKILHKTVYKTVEPLWR